jgi:hypothetical protein
VVLSPGDYARDLEVFAVVNDMEDNIDHTSGDAATENAMQGRNNDISKRLVERTDALSLTIFTNAQDGAALYVHGLQPGGPHMVF